MVFPIELFGFPEESGVVGNSVLRAFLSAVIRVNIPVLFGFQGLLLV